MSSITAKECRRESTKKLLLGSFQQTKSTQTRGSVFADRTQQVKKTNIEKKLIIDSACRMTITANIRLTLTNERPDNRFH